MPVNPSDPAALYADLKNAMRDVVRDYGARGDGVTDDTAAINKALAEVAIPGGVVFFPAGTYLVSSDLLVTGSGIVLLGAGRGSVIMAAANSVANCLKLNGCTHVTIRDLSINGNKSNVQQLGAGTQYTKLNGIYITGCDDITVTGCWITNYYAGGILADSSTNLLISHNRISGGIDNGIFLRPSPGNVSCSQATIVGNIVSGGSFNGIVPIRCTYVTIADNVCYSNGPSAGQGAGVCVEGCQYVAVGNNVCFSNGVQGIHIRYTSEGGANQGSSHVAVTGNVCYNHTSSNGDAGGISVDDTDDIVVSGNLCYANYWGINLNGGQAIGVTHCALVGNVCRANTNIGIHINPTVYSDLQILNCYSGDNSSDGLFTTSRVAIIGGIYKGSTTASTEGIRLTTGGGASASGSVIQGALIYDNADNGVLIASPVANVEVRGCTFDNVAGTTQGRALFESSGAGPTRLVNCRIRNQSFQDFAFNNASSVARQNDDVTNGYRDEASGTATIAASTTSITVTHNLYTTPVRVLISPTADGQSGIRYWVSAKTSTTFTITASSAPATTGVSFDWVARTWEA